MKKEILSGNNLSTTSVFANLITEEILHRIISSHAPELCRWLNEEIALATANAVVRKTVPVLDLALSFPNLSADELMMLFCIDHVRCAYNISGRKWLSVMLAVQQRFPNFSLNETYDFLKRLYGENWHIIDFDFYNAIRNYPGTPSSHGNPQQEKSQIVYPGVKKKYREITGKLVDLFEEYLPQ